MRPSFSVVYRAAQSGRTARVRWERVLTVGETEKNIRMSPLTGLFSHPICQCQAWGGFLRDHRYLFGSLALSQGFKEILLFALRVAATTSSLKARASKSVLVLSCDFITLAAFRRSLKISSNWATVGCLFRRTNALAIQRSMPLGFPRWMYGSVPSRSLRDLFSLWLRDSKTNQSCFLRPVIVQATVSPTSKGRLKRGVGGGLLSSPTRERSWKEYWQLFTS